ncbi:MAG: hypothetical protein J5806_11045 [Lentisphaeria bacterium]|nr:hypothetical protein [Lentisphaeria bacterium]
MMEKERKHPDGEPRFGAEPCIAAENLSAELDGEYHFSSAEQEHLAHCPHCRSLYESYRVIDDAVTRSLTVNCPAAASERIRRRVNRQLDALAPMHAHKPIRFSALAARVAAGVVLAAMVGYLIFVDNPYSEELDDTARPLPTAAVEVHPEPAPAAVDVRHVRPIATGTDAVQFMDPASVPAKSESVAVIPQSVKQVWLFEPAWKDGRLEKNFLAALEKAGIPRENVSLTPADDGAFRANLNLTRYQSVVLNRQLAGLGLQLISADQPQPEQKLFAGTGREAVFYEAVFIPRTR